MYLVRKNTTKMTPPKTTEMTDEERKYHDEYCRCPSRCKDANCKCPCHKPASEEVCGHKTKLTDGWMIPCELPKGHDGGHKSHHVIPPNHPAGEQEYWPDLRDALTKPNDAAHWHDYQEGVFAAVRDLLAKETAKARVEELDRLMEQTELGDIENDEGDVAGRIRIEVLNRLKSLKK